MCGLYTDDFKLVSSAAVIRVVTQRFSPTSALLESSRTSGGEALRDDSDNGCGGDYFQVPPVLHVRAFLKSSVCVTD